MPDHKYSLTSSLLNLGRCLIFAGRTDDAERVLRESLSTLPKSAKGSPIWHDVTISLGTCLLHRKQYADAEAAYLSSLKSPEGWVWIETFDHRSRATEAYEGLLSIYSVTGQLEKAKQLRKTRPPEIAPKPRIVR